MPHSTQECSYVIRAKYKVLDALKSILGEIQTQILVVLKMHSISSLFHGKNPGQDKEEKEHKDGETRQQPDLVSGPPEPPPPYVEAEEQPRQPPVLHAGVQPISQYAPGTGPAAHAQMVQANNIGMAGGALVGSAMGENPVTGMLEGQVGANMVMQRVQQAQRHQYWREQALRYRDGLPAAGVGPAGGLAPLPQQGGEISDGRRSRSQRRDERRRARWERRARRRDGVPVAGGHESSSGGESD